jgi:uncharacterized LabA/DUF88 family protein
MNNKKSMRKTFVFIDVSNMRSACRMSGNFEIDFVKYYGYLVQKYPNLKEVRYYEGISRDDIKKKEHFKYLSDLGYIVCSLERKGYINKARFKECKCPNCSNVCSVCISPSSVKLKSNVDVFLASNMLKTAIKEKGLIHIVLVSCDGDYAESIKDILELRADVFISIMATQKRKKNNYLSARLCGLRDKYPDRIALINIENIKDKIKR